MQKIELDGIEIILFRSTDIVRGFGKKISLASFFLASINQDIHKAKVIVYIYDNLKFKYLKNETKYNFNNDIRIILNREKMLNEI